MYFKYNWCHLFVYLGCIYTIWYKSSDYPPAFKSVLYICQSLISSDVLQKGKNIRRGLIFQSQLVIFLFWHWSSIRVLRIKPIWENRLVFKWGKYFSGLMFKLTRGCLVFCWWWEDYRQWTMSYHPRSANSQGSQHIGGNVSLNRTALSLIFWVHLSLIVWCRLCVIAFMLD